MTTIDELKLAEIDALRTRVTAELRLLNKRAHDVFARADAHRKALAAACESGLALAATVNALAQAVPRGSPFDDACGNAVHALAAQRTER